ncbi:hypothetical protein [Tardiphaga sp. 367_B4_N1_1]|uniref:hypothetical protein n=1 Tax=Tardiphaga sp. 367_B4_N1_1 TaxID=3240777 RepID=UPI003F28D808
MSNIIEIVRTATPSRPSDEYDTPWRDYYRSMRSMMDRDTAMRLADQHIAYLRKRDAEILAGVAAAMGET